MESIVEADGVTSLKPESELKNMYSGYQVAKFIQESAKVLGRQRLASISITDYNPIIEDQRTGRMMAEFFYRLCLGLAMNLS